MFYFITTKNGFIESFGTAEKEVCTVISEQQYAEVLSAARSKPSAPDGYSYMLRADNLEWKLVEQPPEPEPDPTAEDILDTLFGGDAT